jgi:hypothetical protein
LRVRLVSGAKLTGRPCPPLGPGWVAILMLSRDKRVMNLEYSGAYRTLITCPAAN